MDKQMDGVRDLFLDGVITTSEMVVMMNTILAKVSKSWSPIISSLKSCHRNIRVRGGLSLY